MPPADPSALARDLLVWGLPSVDLYRTLDRQVLDPSSPEYKAPFNELAHSRRLADPSDRSIVATNVDTPYSYAWLDLRAEPVVLTMPPFGEDRYVSAMVADLHTYIVGYLSPRTTGRDGVDALVVGPGWAGEAPDGMVVLRCETDLAVVLIRTELFDDTDLPQVERLQDAMAVRPLSAVLGTPAPPPAPPLDPIAPVDVRAAPDPRFFDVLRWMCERMPPLPEDAALRARMADLDGAPVEDVIAGMAAGLAAIGAYARTLTSSAPIFGSREHFHGEHLPRAAGALLGILGNAAEEYLGVGYQTDSEGRPFDGSREFRITFPPGGLPPVDAFWSITVYDADKALYANELDRYALRRRDVSAMRREVNGALTLLVQHERPAEEDVPNWLPCPDGPFGLTFRTYLPAPAIRDGSWTAPPVVAVADRAEVAA